MIDNKQLDKQGLTPKIVQFLREIVAIPSLSGGEGAVIERIREEMETVGWEDVHLDQVGNLRGKLGDGKHQRSEYDGEARDPHYRFRAGR